MSNSTFQSFVRYFRLGRYCGKKFIFLSFPLSLRYFFFAAQFFVWKIGFVKAWSCKRYISPGQTPHNWNSIAKMATKNWDTNKRRCECIRPNRLINVCLNALRLFTSDVVQSTSLWRKIITKLIHRMLNYFKIVISILHTIFWFSY